MVFRGNIARGITGNTFSDNGMLFETFLMKNIFIIFPTPILNHHFYMISSKNSMISIRFINTLWCIRHKLSSLLLKSMKFSWLFEARLTFMYDYIRQNICKPLDFLMKSCKKYCSKYELEKWWKYFSSEMPEIIFPRQWKCFRWCLWRNFLEKPWFFHAFSCFLLTVGFPIVNTCSMVSPCRNAHC